MVWSTVSSLVVWVLWKARCKCVFQKVKQKAVELVNEIWLMLLHTLRGQYEVITSEPEVVILHLFIYFIKFSIALVGLFL